MKRFIIAGHNTKNKGALAFNGKYEHEYTTEVQRLVKEKIQEGEYLEGTSMTDQESMSNMDVINLINENSSPGDYALDIHFNNNRPTATGVEVVVHPNTSLANKARASYLVNVISMMLNIPARRRQPGRDYIFPSETYVGKIGIIEKTSIPVILLEVCFLNKGDLLQYEARKYDVAKIIADTMFNKNFDR